MDISSLPPDLLKIYKKALEESLGSILIGYSIAAIFYGCSCVQTFIYFRVSPRDGLLMKLSILFIWLMDSVHTSLLAACMYIVVVKEMNDLTKLIGDTWTLSSAIYITCAIELCVRALFTSRVWKLSRGNKPLLVVLISLSLAVFGTSLHFGLRVQHLKGFQDLHTKEFLVYLPFGLGLATDVLMTVGQCVLLWRNRTGFAASDSIVRTLTVYILNTGVLICVVTTAILVAYAVSSSLIFVGIYLVLPKAFFNALLASLNVRELIFGDSADLPPPSPGAKGREARRFTFMPPLTKSRSKNSRSGEDPLAVRVETTTMHRIDGSDGKSDMWIPMDEQLQQDKYSAEPKRSSQPDTVTVHAY